MNDLPTIDPSLNAREGKIDFRGYQVWYGCVGEREELPGKLPLLCLHRGPGAGHDYLESLAALARRGRRVIFYDQLGCGNSDQPDDPSLRNVELFVEEVDVVRRALGLDRLPEIVAPMLVASGRHDEATRLIAGTVHRGIRGSEWVVFEDSSHMAHVEEAVRYMKVLDEFLCRHDPN